MRTPKVVILVKKIAVILFILAVGLVGFGKLPKPIADRITKALFVIMLFGFCIRVGAYLLNQ